MNEFEIESCLIIEHQILLCIFNVLSFRPRGSFYFAALCPHGIYMQMHHSVLAFCSMEFELHLISRQKVRFRINFCFYAEFHELTPHNKLSVS